MNIKISVIIPAYNTQEYIKKCLDSVLNQTYDNIEIVVVDDGSEDSTPQILDEYGVKYPEKVKVIHVPNGGVTNARFLGVKESSGQWIGFVDSDDEIDPDMYERLLHNALEYNADISHCGYKSVLDHVPRFYFYNTGKKIEQNNMDGLRDLISGEFVEPGLCNKLFNRDIFVKVLQSDSIDRNIKIYEDLLVNYYLFLNSRKSIYEDFCPYSYMVRSFSATRSGHNKNTIYDPIKVMEHIMKNAPIELHSFALKRYLSACVSSYTVLCCVDSFKDERLEIKKLLLGYKSDWKLMSRNTQIKLYISVYMPKIYKFVYKLYEKYIQKKKYL